MIIFPVGTPQKARCDLKYKLKSRYLTISVGIRSEKCFLSSAVSNLISTTPINDFWFVIYMCASFVQNFLNIYLNNSVRWIFYTYDKSSLKFEITKGKPFISVNLILLDFAGVCDIELNDYWDGLKGAFLWGVSWSSASSRFVRLVSNLLAGWWFHFISSILLPFLTEIISTLPSPKLLKTCLLWGFLVN